MAHRQTVHPFARPLASQAKLQAGHSGKVREDILLLGVVEILGVRDPAESPVGSLRRIKGDQLIGVSQAWQRAKQQSVDQTEGDRIGTDAESERHNNGEGNRWGLGKRAKSNPQILGEVEHVFFSMVVTTRTERHP